MIAITTNNSISVNAAPDVQEGEAVAWGES